MAATEFEFKRYTDAFVLRVSDLIINEAENGRRKTRISDEFVQSMLAGQIQPVKVRKVNNRWKLVAGFRRARAISYINEHKLLPEEMLIRVEVDKSLNDETAFLANIRENKDREDVTALDHASNIGRLKDLFSWNDERIAEFYGKTGAWVSKTRKLLQLDAKFQDLIDERLLTAAQAERLVDCEEDFREQIYAQIKSDGFCKFSASDITAKAREEGKTDTSRNAALKPKAIKGFFEALAEPEEGEEVPAHVSEFAKVTLKWLAGHSRMGNAKFYAEIEARLKTR